ncbi:hypothetical protein IWZ00DRAFT_131293 [Phyllosticta capitalensis]
MDDAQDRIQPNFAGTFEWIFKQPNAQSWNSEKSFVCWLLAEEPVFWIVGKPASGKSTLMKSIHEHPELKTYLRSWIGPGELVTACCFIRRTSKSRLLYCGTGILRSLLCQMISQVPQLVSVVRAAWNANKSISDFSKSSKWSWNQLERAFRNCLAQKPSGVKFFLLVDGLDEFESLDEGDDPTKEKLSRERNNDLTTTLKLLLEVEHYHDVKICLASRRNETIQNQLAHFPSLSIHENTRNDIKLFTEKKLRTFEDKWQRFQPDIPDALEQISERIQYKAQGVFMWVAVVVGNILEDFQHDPSFSDLEDEVECAPQELSGADGLYAKSLARHDITGKRRDQGLRLLYHVYDCNQLGSFLLLYNNLTVLGIAEELKATKDGIPPSIQQLAARIGSTEKCQTELVKRTESRVKSCTAGLLEIQDNGNITWVHETVGEFLKERDFCRSIMSTAEPGKQIQKDESRIRIVIASFLFDVHRVFFKSQLYHHNLLDSITVLAQLENENQSLQGEHWWHCIIDGLLDMAKSVDTRGLKGYWDSLEEQIFIKVIFNLSFGLKDYFFSRVGGMVTPGGRPLLDICLSAHCPGVSGVLRGVAGVSDEAITVEEILKLPGCQGPNEFWKGETIWQRYLQRAALNQLQQSPLRWILCRRLHFVV